MVENSDTIYTNHMLKNSYTPWYAYACQFKLELSNNIHLKTVATLLTHNNTTFRFGLVFSFAHGTHLEATRFKSGY